MPDTRETRSDWPTLVRIEKRRELAKHWESINPTLLPITSELLRDCDALEWAITTKPKLVALMQKWRSDSRKTNRQQCAMELERILTEGDTETKGAGNG